ncbi:MAG: hypothetical protein RXR20_32190 [Paraburkholderia sp.]
MKKMLTKSISPLFSPLFAALLVVGLAACSKQGPDTTAAAPASGASAPAASGPVTVVCRFRRSTIRSSFRCARAPKTRRRRKA